MTPPFSRALVADPRVVFLEFACTRLVLFEAGEMTLDVAFAAEHGYKSGWTALEYREEFGTWRPQNILTPIAPSPEVGSVVAKSPLRKRGQSHEAT